MIKLVLISHFYPKHKGGIEIAAYKTALNIADTERVTINWLAAYCDDNPSEVDYIAYEPLKMFNFIERYFPFPYPLPSISAIFKLYKNIKLSDAVHIHEFIYPTSIIGFIFAKITNKTIVITQHIGYIPYKNRVFASLLSIANKTIGRIILGNADAVIFISNNVLNYFKSFIAAKNFYLQTNSVDIHNFLIYPEIKRKYLRHELNVESYNSIVLFVGRFTEKKGINKIIDFARKYKKILWLFVGWGNIHPEQYSLANVKVINDIDHSKMPDYYNSADYLFLPSYGEGFPLVIQEAFACGLQVLTTTENSVAYPQAEHLIINYDIDDLESWNYLFERIDARVHPNHHNPIDLRNFAIGHWSEEKNGDFYLSLFQELLIGKRRQS